MAVLIGGGTTIVSGQFPNGGITSVQFGFNPQVTRLWELGSFSPYDSFVQKTRTLTVNVYGSRPDGGGGSLQVAVAPSTTCVDAGTVHVTINPASCVSSLSSFAEDYFVTGYSYQKDNMGYGQETWSFTSKPEIPGYSGSIVMLRGIAEGQIATGDGIMPSDKMGVIVDETASNDSLGANIEGESGSVQAGSPGLGTYDIQRFVIVGSIGGSIGKDTSIDGLSGQANIQIPMNTVFL